MWNLPSTSQRTLGLGLRGSRIRYNCLSRDSEVQSRSFGYMDTCSPYNRVGWRYTNREPVCLQRVGRSSTHLASYDNRSPLLEGAVEANGSNSFRNVLVSLLGVPEEVSDVIRVCACHSSVE